MSMNKVELWLEIVGLLVVLQPYWAMCYNKTTAFRNQFGIRYPNVYIFEQRPDLDEGMKQSFIVQRFLQHLILYPINVNRKIILICFAKQIHN